MTASPSDAALVAQAREGVSGAFDRLVDRYWNAAVAMARQRTHNAADAHDAAQNAFVLAFRKLERLRDPEKFAGWLFTIVARASVDGIRRAARQPRSVEDVTLLKPQAAAPDGADPVGAHADRAGPDREELRQAIHQAIEELPQRYRPVVVLRYGQGMDVKSIAAALGIPLGTVVSQMFRANRLLRKRLRHLVTTP